MSLLVKNRQKTSNREHGKSNRECKSERQELRVGSCSNARLFKYNGSGHSVFEFAFFFLVWRPRSSDSRSGSSRSSANRWGMLAVVPLI